MSLYAELFQHLMSAYRNKEIPKQVRNGSRVFAFTLAEVLITLVIIGVIAALTIPNLMQKYTEQTTVKKVQKFYSNLSNAYKLAMKDNGTADEWGLTPFDEPGASKIYTLLFKPYFKIAKDCGVKNTGKCLKNERYKYLNNSVAQSYGELNYHYKLLLDDGSAVSLKVEEHPNIYNIAIMYDINGKKEPNTWGKDMFYFAIKNNKVFPVGIQSGDFSHNPFNGNCNNTTSTGSGCTAWIIYKGNMDYLHCDLTWDKHSCKDK